jgi:DNA-binding response OmpR family regulator
VVVGSGRKSHLASWHAWESEFELTLEPLPSARTALDRIIAEPSRFDLAILYGGHGDLTPVELSQELGLHEEVLTSIVYVAESYSPAAHRAVMLAGAAHFLGRPCPVALVQATAQAELLRLGHLRRAVTPGGRWRRLELDRRRGILRIDTWRLELSPVLLELAYLLASREGEYVSVIDIAREALGVESQHDTLIRDRVYQQIRRLRRVLPPGLWVEERRGEGYRLVRAGAR